MQDHSVVQGNQQRKLEEIADNLAKLRMEVNETAGARSSEQRQEDPWAGYMLTRNKEASTRSAANASRPDSNGDDGGLTDEERRVRSLLRPLFFYGAHSMHHLHRESKPARTPATHVLRLGFCNYRERHYASQMLAEIATIGFPSRTVPPCLRVKWLWVRLDWLDYGLQC